MTFDSRRSSSFASTRHAHVFSLFALIAGLLIAGGVSAQDWHYRVRPGDTLWDLSTRHLRTPSDWPRLQAYNQVDDPMHLVPGSRLRFPIAWLRVSPAPARVVALSGPVHARASASTDAIVIARDHRLDAGAVLETGAGASATVAFADGSRLLVLADSRIVFDTLSAFGDTGMVDTRMRLQRGRIENRVRRAVGPASSFIIDTAPATSAVRGTQFRVAADADGSRAVTEVIEGAVDVDSRAKRRRLTGGFGLAVGADAGAGEPAPLLPAPALTDDPSVRAWRPMDVVEWPPVPGAARYRLQLAQDDELGPVHADVVVDEPRASLPEVADGAYRLRIRAIDAGGLEGHDGTWPLTVHAKPEPPFAIAPGAEDRLTPGRVRFRWTASDGAAGYRLQLARSQAFDELLLDRDAGRRTSLRPREALDEGVYFWRVATRADDGRLGPFGDPQRFEVRAGPASPELQAPRNALRHTIVRWQAGAPGHRYHFQLARDQAFEELLIDATVDEASMRLDPPPRGRVYLRVREIDTDGYAGPFGPPQRIDVPCWSCRLGAAAAVLALLLL